MLPTCKNVSKWVEMLPNCKKCLLMGRNATKWIEILVNG